MTQSQIAQTLCDKLIEAGLDEELAVKAVMHIIVDRYCRNKKLVLSYLKLKVSDIVWVGFVWEHTPEGHDFWSNIAKGLK